MFPGMKIRSDTSNSVQRFLDFKRDGITRAKHLKVALECVTVAERRQLLEESSFEAFYLFHELISTAELAGPLAAKEGGAGDVSLRFALWTLEQLLCYLPHLFAKKWQYQAVGSALKRCMHPLNQHNLRKIAIKPFILWYQIVCDERNDDLDLIFQVLIPGMPLAQGNNSEKLLEERCETPRGFRVAKGVRTDTPPYLHKSQPLIHHLLSTSDKQGSVPHQSSQASLQTFLEGLLVCFARETGKVEWPTDTSICQQEGLKFLIRKFRKYYVSVCFPDLDGGGGVDVDALPPPPLPMDSTVNRRPDLSPSDPILACRLCIIKWVTSYCFSHRNLSDSLNQTGDASHLNTSLSPGKQPNKLPASYELVRQVLFESKANMNFVLSIMKEGLLLPMQFHAVINRILKTLREWILIDDLPVVSSSLNGIQDTIQTLLAVVSWFYLNPYLADEKERLPNAFRINAQIVALIKELANLHKTSRAALSVDSWLIMIERLLSITMHTISPEVADAGLFAQGVATSLFQTLLITWVMASAVHGIQIPPSLWNALFDALRQRSTWAQLIDEWGKVLESVTRALAVNLYKIDLLNLPLERVSEQKMIKSSGSTKTRLIAVATHEAHESYDFCKMPSNIIKPDKNTASSVSSGDNMCNGSHSDQTPSPKLEAAKTMDENTVLDQELNVKHQVAVSANPDSVSLEGSVSLDSNSLGQLPSEKDGFCSPFDDRDSMTPSPIPGIFSETEELGSGFHVDVAAEVDLTPRDEEHGGVSAENWALTWHRLIGIFGDLSTMSVPEIHLRVMRMLRRIAEMLLKVEANQNHGDNSFQFLPLVPPTELLVPYFLSAMQLPVGFEESQLESLEELCHILMPHYVRMYQEEVLACFYSSIHQALQLRDNRFYAAVVQQCSPHFLHENLPGAQILLEDLVSASVQLINADPISLKAVQVIAVVASFPCNLSDTVTSVECGATFFQVFKNHAIKGLVKAATMTEYVLPVLTEKLVYIALACHVIAQVGAGQTVDADTLSVLLGGLTANDAQISMGIVQNLSALHKLQTVEISGTLSDILSSFISAMQYVMHRRTAGLLQHLMTEITEWILEFPAEFLNTSTLMHDFFETLVTLYMSKNMEEDVIIQLKVVLYLLCKSYSQIPMPNFSMAHLSSSHMEPTMILENHFSAECFSLSVTKGSLLFWSVCWNEHDTKLLIRSLIGKHCWRVERFFKKPVFPAKIKTSVNEWLDEVAKLEPSDDVQSQTSDTKSHTADTFDVFLSTLAQKSPECLPHSQFPESLIEPILTHETKIETALQHLVLKICDEKYVMVESEETPKNIQNHPLDNWRSLLSNFHLMSWERKTCLSQLSLQKDTLNRELKHLDNLFTREVHKIAVIYVAEGQEDKQSILSNVTGSVLFEAFVGRLGWEINLATHLGYIGGLASDGSSPYYGSASNEILFHVSTRLSATDSTKKLRHLGNDEVHIVWSEHISDYRKSTIATEFCDVLIVIYPLSNHTFRIQMELAPGLDSIGPLFDGAVVGWTVLPVLVRQTAINASRAKRKTMNVWRHWFHDRHQALSDLRQRYRERLSYSKSLQRLFLPNPPSVYV